MVVVPIQFESGNSTKQHGNTFEYNYNLESNNFQYNYSLGLPIQFSFGLGFGLDKQLNSPMVLATPLGLAMF